MQHRDSSDSGPERQLVGFILRLLRHSPEQAGLRMDSDGWIEKKELLENLRHQQPQTGNWSLADLDAFLALHNDHQRFAVTETQCRASYGHSSLQYQPDAVQKLPYLLYHATSLDFLTWIEEAGLVPMRRRFVQLTESPEYARQLASTFEHAIILTIRQPKKGRPLMGHSTGSHVWLTAHVPPWNIRYHPL